MAGIDGVSRAFLLVQHADEDPAFQRRALELAKPLMESRGMSRRQYAMLADRVSPGRRRAATPTSDLDGLDKRRSQMALGPYQAMLDSAKASRP
ncbi:hypothetical protein G6F61_014375 [Rhizopus arrhizus]|nr:hypothetical protein G6F61_014375 [Rhizopus arrhizus]